MIVLDPDKLIATPPAYTETTGFRDLCADKIEGQKSAILKIMYLGFSEPQERPLLAKSRPPRP